MKVALTSRASIDVLNFLPRSPNFKKAALGQNGWLYAQIDVFISSAGRAY